MWIAAYIAFNIPKPYSILHLFNGWATTGGLKNRKLCFIGAAALICVLWTSRNNLVFDNSPTKTYMQVLFRGTYWLRQWAQLQRREDMVKCCCRHAACWRRWHFSFSWTLVGTSEIELAHLNSYDGVMDAILLLCVESDPWDPDSFIFFALWSGLMYRWL
jgi:hypothetical protein